MRIGWMHHHRNSTPPPAAEGGSVLYPNEPAGMTALIDCGFSNGWPPPVVGGGSDADGWNWEYNVSNTSIITDGTAPFPSGNVMRTTFPVGHAGGTAPSTLHNTFKTHAGLWEIVYVSVQIKRSAGWDDNGNAGTKENWVVNGIDSSYVAANPVADRYFGNEPLTSGGDYVAYYGPADTFGTWRQYEYLFVANSLNGHDGTFSAWKNGSASTFMYRDSFAYNGTGIAPGFREFKWSPTYGGGSNDVPTEQYIDLNYVYVSGKHP